MAFPQSKSAVLAIAIILMSLVTGAFCLATGQFLPRDKISKVLKHECDMDTVKIETLISSAEQAMKTWSIDSPEFFVSPMEIAGINKAFQGIAECQVEFAGGFKMCERHRVFFTRNAAYSGDGNADELEPNYLQTVSDSDAATFISAVNIKGNFIFDKAQHSEFVEAVNTVPGVDKDQIGDVIVVGDRGCNALVLPAMSSIICKSLKSLRSVPLTVTPIALSELALRPTNKKEMTLVEASARLDAVASAGFGYSRTKMAKLIEAGDVLVNWKAAKAPSIALHGKDAVFIRGCGKLLIEEIALTSKGKMRIKCMRVT